MTVTHRLPDPTGCIGTVASTYPQVLKMTGHLRGELRRAAGFVECYSA